MGKATPEETKTAETAKYVDAIATKFGTFRYTADEPTPSEGVIYDLSDINKNTKMVIISHKKFIKTDE